MNKKIISVLALCLVAVLSFCAVAFAEETASGMPKGEDVYIKSASYNDEAQEFNITIANRASYDIEECAIMLTTADENEDGIAFEPVQSQIHYSSVTENEAQIVIIDFKAGSTATYECECTVLGSCLCKDLSDAVSTLCECRDLKYAYRTVPEDCL